MTAFSFYDDWCIVFFKDWCLYPSSHTKTQQNFFFFTSLQLPRLNVYICTALSQELVNNSSRGSAVPLSWPTLAWHCECKWSFWRTRSISRAGDRQHGKTRGKTGLARSVTGTVQTRKTLPEMDPCLVIKGPWAQCLELHFQPPKASAWPHKELTCRRAEWGRLRKEAPGT